MGFKFKSLHISAFAVIVAISLGLAYMLKGRYSNNKEGLETKTSTDNKSTTGTGTSSTTTGTGTSSTTTGTSVIAPSLGAGQDNYNHFTGKSIPTMFYGPNGSTAKISNQGGAYSVIVTDKNGTNVVYDEQNKSLLSPSNLAAIDMVIDKVVDVITRVQKASSTSASTPASTSTASTSTASTTQSDSVMKYYGPNGAVALMYTDSNGNTNLKLIDGTGKEIAYSSANIQSYNPSVDNPNVPQTMGGPNSSNKMNVSSNYKEAYTQSLTGPDYSSSLPMGIPKNMIPPGNEDLYILKSEVVPPVCPACPPPILKCGDDKPPPPCPPCARCPEPQFDCKKVPNYGSGNLGANYFGGGGQFGSMPSTSGNFLPYPSVSNYSTFGN
jgi:hypothetical protein